MTRFRADLGSIPLQDVPEVGEIYGLADKLLADSSGGESVSGRNRPNTRPKKAGSLDEFQRFTEAFNRLPNDVRDDYLKRVF